jgi:DMSO/TMAO reductase YedYZ heme-binding membrane subunit
MLVGALVQQIWAISQAREEVRPLHEFTSREITFGAIFLFWILALTNKPPFSLPDIALWANGSKFNT